MKNKKWIIVALILVVVVVGFFVIKKVLASSSPTSVGYTELQSAELINSINTKGTVESIEKRNVYTNLGFTIKEVNVKVNDHVTEGQVLLVLDTRDLELDITQKKSDLNASENTAVVNLEKAQKDYKDALKENQDNTNSGLITAQRNLVSAEIDLNTTKTTVDNNKILYDAGAIAQDTYLQSENAYINAQNKYSETLTNLENAKTSERKTLEQYETALKTAQILVSNESQDIAIQKLEKQMEDSIVKSPISGTVTAVYAKKGATGTGLMFVIEDTDRLKITTKIEEYDIGNVKAGMQVNIKSDSTGDSVYEGVLSEIASAAIKDASGETDIKSDIQFDATVEVKSLKTDLKVGSNARLTIFLEKKEDVYYVPSEAVTTNEDGETIVFIADGGNQGKYTAKQIVVNKGMETDFYIEIIGNDLVDGMKVISDASSMQEGAQIILE